MTETVIVALLVSALRLSGINSIIAKIERIMLSPELVRSTEFESVLPPVGTGYVVRVTSQAHEKVPPTHRLTSLIRITLVLPNELLTRMGQLLFVRW